jgi:protein-S-isoprenylcysteine O-methyltransferase Ste14
MTTSFKTIPVRRIWAAAWHGFSRIFVMLGLPLLAWGSLDLNSFFSNPARAAIGYTAMTFAFFMAVMVYRIPPTAKDRPHDEEHWHYSMLELVFILSAYGDRRDVLVWNDNQSLRWLGVSMYIVGFLYSAWSNLVWVNHLRREGTQAREIPALLSEGPFLWTRYPSLTSLICFHIGFTLALRSWVGVFFTIPILYTLVRRVNIWERGYAVEFKSTWGMRQRKSKKVIPFLY